MATLPPKGNCREERHKRGQLRSNTKPCKRPVIGMSGRVLSTIRRPRSGSLTDAQYPPRWTPLNQSLVRRSGIGLRRRVTIRRGASVRYEVEPSGDGDLGAVYEVKRRGARVEPDRRYL